MINKVKLKKCISNALLIMMFLCIPATLIFLVGIAGLVLGATPTLSPLWFLGYDLLVVAFVMIASKFGI